MYDKDGNLLGMHTISERAAYIDQAVEQYKQRHPDTKLSGNHIRKLMRNRWRYRIKTELTKMQGEYGRRGA